MKINFTILIAITLLLISCGGEFNKSVNVDLISGLSTKGDGLGAGDVYLTVKDERVKRNTFTYGEIFHLNFNNVTGFKKEGGEAFPGMELTVVSEQGDTAMHYDDMYAEQGGVDVSPLLLYTNITVAKPMMANNKYKLYVNIWDKKGKGTFKAEFDFDIEPNEAIKVTKDDAIAYDNIYLFSQEEGTVTNNQIKVNQTYYLMFEGLEGFNADNGKVSVGLSMKAVAADGEVLLDEKDLLGEGEWEPSLVQEQISSDFIFRDPSIATPINCEIVVFDKKSEARVSAKVELEFLK